ncbi:MAG: hypothetical protein J6F30_06285 [Cellulosilyticum sp.]|nr:hypothetical protein [Cellulosilyticum sp.]
MIASIVHPHCIKVLPTVYSNSLSYYEELCQFRAKLNEVIEVFNEYESIILELQKALGDITNMQNDINNIKNKLLTLDSTVATLQNEYLALKQVDANQQAEIDELKTKLNNVIISYNSIIDYVDNAVRRVSVENSTAWIRLENYINTQDRILQLQIDELRRAIEGMSDRVYNPVRGVRENLDDNNWDIYQDLRCGGFTNSELSEFGISNEHVASLVHNNRDYALNVKRRFKRHYLFSPVTGKEVSHANAISQAIISVIGSITNNAFVITTNEMLRSHMATNNLTNADIGTLFTNNFERYTLSV